MQDAQPIVYYHIREARVHWRGVFDDTQRASDRRKTPPTCIFSCYKLIYYRCKRKVQRNLEWEVCAAGFAGKYLPHHEEVYSYDA